MKFESGEGINQIRSIDKVEKLDLWRYNLIFKINPICGLIPERFEDYCVSEEPFSNDFLPWSPRDGVNCLVLKKIRYTELSCNLHNIKILIPDVPFNENGRQII